MFETFRVTKLRFLDKPSGRSTSGRLLPKGRKKAEQSEGNDAGIGRLPVAFRSLSAAKLINN